uniref:Uncharacterized protein n=1 Tax=Hyaloperonospora arabidopsidis (strain Emoy2) TaxID=559515 RepID=M4BWS6_HYAAE
MPQSCGDQNSAGRVMVYGSSCLRRVHRLCCCYIVDMIKPPKETVIYQPRNYAIDGTERKSWWMAVITDVRYTILVLCRQ